MHLFDSIAHPTINGVWFNKPHDNTFEHLSNQYLQNNILGGCAVSLPFISLEELEVFYKKSVQQANVRLYPVAAFNFDEENFEQKIKSIKEIGYNAIKIHLRLSKLDIDKDFEKIALVFSICEKYNVIIFFCTYCHTNIELTPLHSLNYYLIALLKRAPKVKIILLHGGDVGLLQLSQLARFNPTILIDLSYTLLKFKGSSLDTDILFLMQHLDRKICVGSDYPEYSIPVFKERVEELSAKVSDVEKIENFSYLNIMNFLNMNP